MADIVCILTNATTGVKRNSKKKKEQLNVRKGELVVEIPKKNQIVQQDGIPPHNYRLLHNPKVSLYDTGVIVIPLQGAEADYLEGVADPTARIFEYRKEQRFRWIMNLKNGDMVFFKLEREKGSKVPLHSKGKICYYGAVEGRNGVAFGIEIMVLTYFLLHILASNVLRPYKLGHEHGLVGLTQFPTDVGNMLSQINNIHNIYN